MDKRIVHAEVDSRTWVDMDGIQNGLNGLTRHANDSVDFEDILSDSIRALYLMLPDGEKNYGGEKPKFGIISLNRCNSKEDGHAVIDWCPSDSWNRNQQNKYAQRHVANINLRDRTYKTPWKDNDGYGHGIPEHLKEDTMTVMKKLCLEREVKKDQAKTA